MIRREKKDVWLKELLGECEHIREEPKPKKEKRKKAENERAKNILRSWRQ